MSNSYLCDACGNSRCEFVESYHNITDCRKYGETFKVVLPDGYKDDPKKLCAYWKERA